MAAPSPAVEPYLEDASGYHGKAEKVFVPSGLDELREIVLASYTRNIPLTVSGAGTGLTGARVPQGGWVVSLERFREVEIQPGRARCGAGALLSDLQNAAAQTKQFFGPNPTESLASIGGIISTNAGGARSFHYGSVRHHILALDVTLMDGRTLHVERGQPVDFSVSPVHQPDTTKNSAGYYLRPETEWVDLLSASEGTLGIVTHAELQLFREPPAILSGLIFFHSDDDALRAVDEWRSIPELRLLEFLDEHALKILRPTYPEIPGNARTALMIEQNLTSEEDEEVEAWLQRLHDHNAFEERSWFGFRQADHERFRELRHTLAATAVEAARRSGFPKFSTDFAVPVNRNRDLHAYYKQKCEQNFRGQYTIYGHVGDANNHVHLFPRAAEQARLCEEVMYDFAEYVVSLGGTVAAEHGIGKNKINLLNLMYSAEEIKSMKDVKRQLDPKWLLGQGNIFGVH